MRRSAPKSNRPLKILAWTAGSIIAVVLLVLIGGQVWLGRYLRSPEFRAMIETKSGIGLRGSVEVGQPHLEGNQFYSDLFLARGTPEAAFSKIKAENIRGEFVLPSFIRLLFGERKVTLENVEVQRIDAEFFDTDRITLDLPPRTLSERQVDLKNGSIRELRVGWQGGGLAGTAVRVNRVDGGWKLEGEGGKLLMQWGLPPLALTSARVVYKEHEHTLIIQDAQARAEGGEVTGNGEFKPHELLDVQFKVTDVNVTPILPEDWRGRLLGRMSGDGRFKLPLGGSDRGFKLSGKAVLKEGVLQALPVLDKIAEYTNTEDYRRLGINQLTGDFTYDQTEGSLRVTNFVVEGRLLRLTGNFNIVKEKLEGSFQVGIPPSLLAWRTTGLEKVFTSQHDGFAWTTMRLGGTTSSPREDLSARLFTAAGEAVAETVQDTATGAAGTVIDTGKKAVTEGLNLLFGKGLFDSPLFRKK
jgi:hypothetical protein